MVERDHQWYGCFYDLALPNWNGHQGVLALHLKADVWEEVSQSALELDRLTEGYRRALGANPPRGTVAALNADQLKSLRTMWDNASKAHRALAKLADAEPRAGATARGCP
jgi:hypothetical protein